VPCRLVRLAHLPCSLVCLAHLRCSLVCLAHLPCSLVCLAHLRCSLVCLAHLCALPKVSLVLQLSTPCLIVFFVPLLSGALAHTMALSLTRYMFSHTYTQEHTHACTSGHSSPGRAFGTKHSTPRLLAATMWQVNVHRVVSLLCRTGR